MIFPHLYLSRVTGLEVSYLRAHGIDGLLIDIDGTLKDFTETTITNEVRQWLLDLQDAGIRLCLLSNGKAPRIESFAREIGLPFVAEAVKPSPKGCLRGLALLELPKNRVAVVGDQIFADVLAGRLAGLHTILLEPNITFEPWFTRLKRPFEKPIRWLIRRRLDAMPDSISTPAISSLSPTHAK